MSLSFLNAMNKTITAFIFSVFIVTGCFLMAEPANCRNSSISDLDNSWGKANPDYASERKATSNQPDTAPSAPSSYGKETENGLQSGDSSADDVKTNSGKTQAQKAKPAGTEMKGQPDQIPPEGYTANEWPLLNHPGKKTAADPLSARFYAGWKTPAGKQMGSQEAADSAMSQMPTWPTMGMEMGPASAELCMECAFRKYEQEKNAPSNGIKKAQAAQQAQEQQASDASADAAEQSFSSDLIIASSSLINVANESAAMPTTTYLPIRLLSQAIWMVQQMLKHVYMPMAILLVLPGAVLTQVKCVAASGMLDLEDEDTINPFNGILRSLIAIFLIPATQLIVSFAVDIGNSMTYEVQKYLVPMELIDWSKEQTFNPPQQNAMNALMPAAAAAAAAGKMTDVSELASGVESQTASTNMMQMGFNMMNMALGFGMIILLAFQIVMMCYLMLMGPIAAALFAWPTNFGSLFSKVFANWVDAVTNLALWRFWWCVVLLCMCTRISWLKEIGQYNPNSQWEMMVFTAFMVILTYVPFMPFDYKPGEMVAKVLEKASQAQQGAGGGGGGGGCGGGGEGGGAQDGGGSTPGGASTDGGGNDDAPSAPSAPSERSQGGGKQDRVCSTDGDQSQKGSDSYSEPPPNSTKIPTRAPDAGHVAVSPPPLSQPLSEPANESQRSPELLPA